MSHRARWSFAVVAWVLVLGAPEGRAAQPICFSPVHAGRAPPLALELPKQTGGIGWVRYPDGRAAVAVRRAREIARSATVPATVDIVLVALPPARGRYVLDVTGTLIGGLEHRDRARSTSYYQDPGRDRVDGCDLGDEPRPD